MNNQGIPRQIKTLKELFLKKMYLSYIMLIDTIIWIKFLDNATGIKLIKIKYIFFQSIKIRNNIIHP